LKFIKIQTNNSDWKVVVFDHSDNPVGEFYASKNPNGNTNRDFPFDITFESPRYEEVMSSVLLKQDVISNWLADELASNPFTL
jgi:hypothetical protein